MAVYHNLREFVPGIDNYLAEEMFVQLESGSLFVKFHGMFPKAGRYTSAEELPAVNSVSPILF